MFLPSNITLQFGDSGDYVTELQRRLSTLNYLSSDMLTGFYDGATVTAVRSFQTASAIRADGIAGPETLRRLNGYGDSSSDSNSSTGEKEEDKVLFYQREEQRQLLLQKEAELAREQALKQREIELGLSTSTPAAGLESTLSQNKQLDTLSQEFAKKSQENLQDISRELNFAKRNEIQRENELFQSIERASDAQRRSLTGENLPPQQAFIDRPIQQTFQSPAKEELGKDADPSILSFLRSPGSNTPEVVGKDGVAKTGNVSSMSLSAEKENGLGGNPASGQKAAAAFFGAQEPTNQPSSKSAAIAQDPRNSRESFAGQNNALGRQNVTSMSETSSLSSPDFQRIRMQIESRLSPPVIQEVKQVGVVMMEHGVNPARMPPSIEAPAQTPNTPERTTGAARGA